MAGSINDKLTATFNAANPNVARVTSSRTAGATTLACDNLAGWPTSATSAVHFSTYQINTNGAVVAGTQIDWKGLVSGNNIGTLTRLAGATDAGNSIGDVVEAMPTGSWAQGLYDWGTAEHNTQGVHALTANSSITSSKIITSLNDTNGNELIRVTPTASAVNDITVINGATGNSPQIAASGDDTNVDIRLTPKGTGNVKRGVTGGSIDWWEEIGRTALVANADVISVTIPARKFLRVLVTLIPTGGTIDHGFRFNGDTAANYSYRRSINGSADTTSGLVNYAYFDSGTLTTTLVAIDATIINILNQDKLIMGSVIGRSTAGASSAADKVEYADKWANTAAQITTITCNNTSGTGDFAIGSEVIVLGHD